MPLVPLGRPGASERRGRALGSHPGGRDQLTAPQRADSASEGTCPAGVTTAQLAPDKGVTKDAGIPGLKLGRAGRPSRACGGQWCPIYGAGATWEPSEVAPPVGQDTVSENGLRIRCSGPAEGLARGPAPGHYWVQPHLTRGDGGPGSC